MNTTTVAITTFDENCDAELLILVQNCYEGVVVQSLVEMVETAVEQGCTWARLAHLMAQSVDAYGFVEIGLAERCILSDDVIDVSVHHNGSHVSVWHEGEQKLSVGG